MNAILVIKKGFRAGTMFRLGERPMTLGRSPSNPIQLIDDAASRRHALISWEEGAYVVTDLNSSNGVFINGERVGERRIVNGDEIRIGDSTLQLVGAGHVQVDATAARRTIDHTITKLDTRVSLLASRPGDPPSREQKVMQLLHKLALSAARRLSGAKQHATAAQGLCNAIGADRVGIFMLGDTGRARVVARGYSVTLDAVDAAIRPVTAAMHRAVTTRSPALLNQVRAVHSDGRSAVSAAAVPIFDEQGAVAGVIYADVLHTAQGLTNKDVEVMAMAAQVLRGSLANAKPLADAA